MNDAQKLEQMEHDLFHIMTGVARLVVALKDGKADAAEEALKNVHTLTRMAVDVLKTSPDTVPVCQFAWHGVARQ